MLMTSMVEVSWISAMESIKGSDYYLKQYLLMHWQPVEHFAKKDVVYC